MGSSPSREQRRTNDTATLQALLAVLESHDNQGLELILGTIQESLDVDASEHGLYHRLVLHSIKWSPQRTLEACRLLQSKAKFLPSYKTNYAAYSLLSVDKTGWTLHSDGDVQGKMLFCRFGDVYPLVLAQNLWTYYQNDSLAVVMKYLSGTLITGGTVALPPGGVSTTC